MTRLSASHRTMLATPVGVPGSGGVRYAAAMGCHFDGMMSHDMLEIYRMCSKFDHEDPVAVAMYEGVPVPGICREDPR